ncbi:MAG: 16S rRNA (guanine(527)-N(7))-methyltransferase RsmG [Firmicutes bacterium]|nr:16S rRNA (guanine(527)-N(7))-methyltransferase RsmG [Bacillota bacterium]
MVKMKIDSFVEELKKLKIDCHQKQLEMLNIYYEYLIEYNSHTNLTAITEKEDIYLKHFYDSLTLNSVIDLNQIDNMIDIGSGAGFPGVVLKIFFPHMHVTILDSNNKKTTFVAKLIEKLGLSGIEVVNARAEDYAKDKMNSFDMCVSRAVAFIDIITELSLPLIKKSGKVALMKGNFENEIVTLKKYQQKLNISNYKINKVILPNNDERNIVILEKEKETNKLLTYSQIVKRNKVWNDKK